MLMALQLKRFIKQLCFMFLVMLVVFGLIGGCNNGGGGNDGFSSNAIHGVILGVHPEDGLEALLNAMDISEHTGEPNHIHIWGPAILDITDEEKVLIREAFDAEFVISVYQVDAAIITYLYKVILEISNVFEEIEDIENTDPGQEANTFSIEKHGSLIWTSKSHSDFTDFKTFQENTIDGDPTEGLNDFLDHALHKREWIESYTDRREKLVNEGFLEGNVSSIMEKKGLEAVLDQINEDLVVTTNETSFTSGDGTDFFSYAEVQSNFFIVGFTKSEGEVVGEDNPDATTKNVYEIINFVWAVSTNNSPDGPVVYIMVEQKLNLASGNGYDEMDEKPQKDGRPTHQVWILQQFKNTNTLLDAVGIEISNPDALLLDSNPETTQFETSETTSTISHSISGSVGLSASGAPSGSISGGATWSSSTTFQKANVQINNRQNDTIFFNDATFEYLPRMPEIFEDKCNNSMFNLADLAKATFKPTQLMVWRIDGGYADSTVSLNTQYNITITNAYIDNCNIFGCNCDVVFNDKPLNGKTAIHFIHLPPLPSP